MDLILSDLHANLHALDVVLRFARRRPIRRFVLLGDLVGYGAHPNQVMDKVRALRPRFLVRGNHDKVCSGVELPFGFSAPARQSAEWTYQHLRKDHRRYLESLPQGPLSVEGDFSIAHGSPQDEDAYLMTPREALHAFDAFEGQACFFGHTHLPGAFELDEEAHALTWIHFPEERWFTLRPGCRYLINPGSVGQPRDRDRRVSFATYDPNKRRIRLHRLEYDWDGAASSILAAHLHEHLAIRLSQGV